MLHFLRALGELRERTVNIIDHLDKLLPKATVSHSKKGPIGLVTFQNGMMNNYDVDFAEMSQMIVDQLPEGPLCIGLYNQTTKCVATDMLRFTCEESLNMESVYSLSHLFLTFSELLPRISPHLAWAHFAHSEGGLIANAALKLCEQKRRVKEFIKESLVTATYGAVKPIPDEPVNSAINTYADHDIALFFGKNYIDRDLSKTEEKSFVSKKVYEGKTYTIKVVETLLEDNPLIKFDFESPENLTIEERLNLSWCERLSRLSNLEGSPRLACEVNTRIRDGINNTAFAIKDHGFREETYKNELKKDIDDLREEFRIYEAKIYR